MISFDPDSEMEWLVVMGRKDSTRWAMTDTFDEVLNLLRDENEDDKMHSVRIYRKPIHPPIVLDHDRK